MACVKKIQFCLKGFVDLLQSKIVTKVSMQRVFALSFFDDIK